MRNLSLILISLALLFSASTQAAESTKKSKSKSKNKAPAQTAAASYAQRSDAMAWAERMAQDNQLDPQWVKAQLAQAKLIPSIPKLILPPAQVSQKIGRPTEPASSSPSAFKRAFSFGSVTKPCSIRPSKLTGCRNGSLWV
jgi:membrane-bound lytic murein transglycosylase B